MSFRFWIKNIFESIYYGSVKASMGIAKEREHKMRILKSGMEQYDNSRTSIFVSSDKLMKYRDEMKPIQEELERDGYLGTYSSYIGSPLYHGKLQFDLWNERVDDSLFDWTTLREDIKKHGVRNSLLVAPMPTASTSQILGNYECIEPVMSNIYTRRVLAGEFTVINEYLVKELLLYGFWNQDMKNKIILNEGSVQNIKEIPLFIRERYKTAWEIKQKSVIDMSADRGRFICQSQSLNLFVKAPNFKLLSSMHFYGWKQGLKTGMYYLRTRPSSKAIQFTLEPETPCETCSA